MRIGLLGGSFDPIHEGHIHIAKTAYRHLKLDEVWFLPTLATPLKDKQLTDFETRCQMIRMILKPYRHFKLSLIETKNTLPSYTVNTAVRLRKMHPDWQFYFIIGTDQLLQLDKWKDYDKLTELLQFVCIARNQDKAENDRVIMINDEIHPASSTAIRNGDFRYIPKRLRRFIMDKGLYDESIARSLVSEKRWTHVKSVAALAADIAKANHLDPDKAYRAGLFHDCTKRLSYQDNKRILDLIGVGSEKELEEPVWHQVTGGWYLKKYYSFDDKEICNAIRHHTTGDLNQPLVKVLYAADKLDPSRGYDSSATIDLCLKDLDKGFEEVKKQQHDYLVATGVIQEEKLI